jgi:hypothetical protein
MGRPIPCRFQAPASFSIDTNPVPARTGFCCAWIAAAGQDSELAYGFCRVKVSEAELMQ